MRRVNWWAIGVSTLVFFVLAWAWFDVVFQRQWVSAMLKIGPLNDADESIPYLLVLTLGMPFMAVCGLAQLLAWRGPTNPFQGALIGLGVGAMVFGSMAWLIFAHSGWGAVLASIDIGYVLVGMTVSGFILGAWKQRHPKTGSAASRAGSLFLYSGIAAAVLNLFVVFLLGAIRPGYNAWQSPDSALELSQGGWVQIANYLVTGVLLMVFVIGLRRALHPGPGSLWGPVLLGLYGLSFVGIGIFVTDPAPEYPPGAITESTIHGLVHNVLGLLQFASVIAACFVLARRGVAALANKSWALYSWTTAGLVAASYVLFAITYRLGGPAGLIERIGVVAACGWIAVLALRLMGGGRARDSR